MRWSEVAATRKRGGGYNVCVWIPAVCTVRSVTHLTTHNLVLILKRCPQSGKMFGEWGAWDMPIPQEYRRASRMIVAGCRIYNSGTIREFSWWPPKIAMATLKFSCHGYPKSAMASRGLQPLCSRAPLSRKFFSHGKFLIPSSTGSPLIPSGTASAGLQACSFWQRLFLS